MTDQPEAQPIQVSPERLLPIVQQQRQAALNVIDHLEAYVQMLTEERDQALARAAEAEAALAVHDARAQG